MVPTISFLSSITVCRTMQQNVNNVFLDCRKWTTCFCQVAEKSYTPKSATFLLQQQSI